MEEQSCWLRTSVEGQSLTVNGGGDWTVQNLAYLDPLLGGLEFDNFSHVTMDVAGLTALDTAGAHIIHRLMNELDRGGIEAVLSGLAVAYRPLLEIVAEADDQPHEPLHEESHFILAMFERVGRALIDALIEAKSLVNFFGLTIVAFGSAIAKPRRLRPIQSRKSRPLHRLQKRKTSTKPRHHSQPPQSPRRCQQCPAFPRSPGQIWVVRRLQLALYRRYASR